MCVPPTPPCSGNKKVFGQNTEGLLSEDMVKASVCEGVSVMEAALTDHQRAAAVGTQQACLHLPAWPLVAHGGPLTGRHVVPWRAGASRVSHPPCCVALSRPSSLAELFPHLASGCQ